jgi:5'-nucleotidase
LLVYPDGVDVTSSIRILVTNDDGVDSPGLWHLAHALSGPGREVVIAAPSRDSSGFAAAVGHIGPGAVFEAHPTEWPAHWTQRPAEERPPAWAVEGPPGRCVLAGVLGLFGPRPHLVVSGINAGANTGRFLQLHSGTLGAALTAANSGISAMAVSLDTVPRPGMEEDPAEHWGAAAQVAAALVDQLAARERGTVWNVNVPNLERDEIAGIAEARLGRSRWAMQLSPVSEGRHEVNMVPTTPRVRAGADAASDDGPTDRELLDGGHVAITSVTVPGLLPVGEVALDLV